MTPSELETRFRQAEFRVRKAEDAGSGVTGAYKILIEFRDGKLLEAKWKTAPSGKGDGMNNSPRKELAAYEIQRWLFEEKDFVVPTSAAVCLPMDTARAIDPAAQPTFAGTSCVFGSISVWMQNVTAARDAYDKERFERDPLYARHLADLNVLTFLIGHRDSNEGNFLVSNDPLDPRIYTVDNGVAFDLVPWNLRVSNWFRIRVPWLRRETVDRVRRVDEAMVSALAVVTELEADANGVLRVVTPGPILAPAEEGVRRSGNRLQLGLDEDEIEDLAERIDELTRKVESGRQAVR